METHYIPSFTVARGQQQQAVCGAWIAYKDSALVSSNAEPTCSACAAWLAALDSVEVVDEAVCSTCGASTVPYNLRADGCADCQETR